MMILEGDIVYCERICDAMETSHCLRSVHIGESYIFADRLSAVLAGLCRVKRLTELTIGTGYGLEGRYVLSL